MDDLSVTIKVFVKKFEIPWRPPGWAFPALEVSSAYEPRHIKKGNTRVELLPAADRTVA